MPMHSEPEQVTQRLPRRMSIHLLFIAPHVDILLHCSQRGYSHLDQQAGHGVGCRAEKGGGVSQEAT